MKNKKLLLISILILFILSVFVLVDQKITPSKGTNPISYEFFTKDQEVNFSAFQQVEFDLSNQHLIESEGVYHITGSTNEPLIIDTKGKVKIILDGISIDNPNGPAIYIPNASFACIELLNENVLSDGTSYVGYDEEVNATIFSKDDLVFMGNGCLQITANLQDGIVSKDHLKFYSGNYQITANDDGIRGSDSIYIVDGNYLIQASGDGMKSTKENDETKGYILIENGSFDINCENDAIQAENALIIHGRTFNITTHEGVKEINTVSDEESHKGCKANNLLQINDGIFIMNCDDDTFHSNDTVEINGGNYTISTSDDAFYADHHCTINDGDIHILECYEGIEASEITINDGTIHLISSDDGINAATKNKAETIDFKQGPYKKDESLLTINGGTILVDASGDGLDSNGDIIINGGSITINGPIENSNSAIDFDVECVINGGELLAIGSSGMVERISENSKQNVMMLTVETTTSYLVIKEGNEELINYVPNKKYSSIIYSSPSLQKDHSYDLYLDDQLTTTLEITEIITSSQNSPFGFDHPDQNHEMRLDGNLPLPFHERGENEPMPTPKGNQRPPQERNEDEQIIRPNRGFPNSQRS